MEGRYLETTLKEGKFCFNRSKIFNSQNIGLHDSQQDRWDSYTTESRAKVRITPILGENENGILYGPSAELDNATVHTISKTAEQTPFCCFRMVDSNDLRVEHIGMVFSLSDNIVERIKTSFGHDSYILISAPGEFMRRIQKKYSIYAREIHYGELTMEFSTEMNKVGLPQARIFQKAESYSWEKEYRIALLTPTENNQTYIEIGPLEDIAIGGNLDELKTGFLITGIDL